MSVLGEPGELVVNNPEGAGVAVYVHIPFCPSKCGYCDFNSYAMDGDIVERTVAAIERQILESELAGTPAKTVFFGGGTPTFLQSSQLERLLDAVMTAHPLSDGCEVTSEANPGTVDAIKFGDMRHMGFNRLSLGAQSFDTSDLIQLGRVHDASQIGTAISSARKSGFDNLNLDLMFALPGQSVRRWENNLKLALSLEPEHLSLYCLTIEPNTRYYKLNLKGMLDLPDEESQIQMYDMAADLCSRAGYGHYEISNFARSGFECAHNICYWKAEDYAGYGPGAVGCADDGHKRTRYVNIKHPQGYCEAVESGKSVWCEQETLDGPTQRFEKIMLGIRLSEGLLKESVSLDTGILDVIKGRGWIEEDGTRVRLTPIGRHFCSEVALALV